MMTEAPFSRAASVSAGGGMPAPTDESHRDSKIVCTPLLSSSFETSKDHFFIPAGRGGVAGEQGIIDGTAMPRRKPSSRRIWPGETLGDSPRGEIAQDLHVLFGKTVRVDLDETWLNQGWVESVRSASGSPVRAGRFRTGSIVTWWMPCPRRRSPARPDREGSSVVPGFLRPNRRRRAGRLFLERPIR